ncbi:MAG: hypothetical protein HYU02_00615 [Thaumarchaeota archaeon]|nr:hypothetical protein [Nitrososphaerota archaeon]
MVSTVSVVTGSLVIIIAVVGAAFMVSTSQRNPDIIFSYDAQFGRVDEFRSAYEGPARPASGILNETFIVRMTNFKSDPAENIAITLSEEPKNNWYALEDLNLGFGNYTFAAEGNKAVIKSLPAGQTTSVHFQVRINITAVDVNNALSDRSLVNFEITYDGISRLITKVLNIRFPPWNP